MKTNQEQLKKITSITSASDFHYWLVEHPEITSLQGYKVNNGLLVNCKGHQLTANEMYDERKAINDWIGTQLNK